MLKYNPLGLGLRVDIDAGTKVEATTKVVGAGPDNLAVWFKVQEI